MHTCLLCATTGDVAPNNSLVQAGYSIRAWPYEVQGRSDSVSLDVFLHRPVAKMSDGGVFSEGNAELLVYLVDEEMDIYIGDVTRRPRFSYR
jgi:hypothetical protein